jgi:hypothetical protein
MFKLLVFPVNLLFMLFINSVFQQEVTVQVSAPQEVTAGDEFQVQLTLKKGNLESFSRLMQELPAGLKAKPVTSSNADFTFKDNKVRLIWLKLPDTEDVTITYTIQVDQRLKGTFSLAGKFSYINNNERESVEAEPISITINPNPNIDPSLIVDIKDFKDKVIPDLTPSGQIAVTSIRQKPQPSGDADNSYIVNILIDKENAQKFAKIEETIPAGYTAIKIDAKEGIFTFKNDFAKFLWMNLPSSPYFVVSYRLVPDAGITEPPVLKGQFSYVVDDKTMVVDIVERDVNVAMLSADDIKQLVAQIRSEASSIQVASVDQGTQVDTTTKQVVTTTTTTTDQVAVTTTKPPKRKWFGKKTVDEQNLAYMLEPEEGIYFRVQIAAGHKPVNIQRYFKKFKINDEIRTELHEGWHKYSIGSFKEYVQARDYRVHVWNTTPITDAFVSAYNSGTRITVQEALMINNQKWYK